MKKHEVASGVAISAAAIGLGLAVAYSNGSKHPGLPLAVAVAVLIAVVFIALRNDSRRRGADSSDDLFRLARWLFLAGVLTSGFGVFRLFFAFTFSDWLFAAAGGFALLGTIQARTKSVLDGTSWLLSAGLGLFIVGGVISASRADSEVASLFVVARVVLVVIGLGWVAHKVLPTERRVRSALWCWCASAAASSYAAMISASIGFTFPHAYSHAGRYSGLSEHPNDLGAIAALTFVPALYLASRKQPIIARGLAMVLLLGIAMGVLLSGSVNSLLTTVISSLILLMVSRHRGRVAIATAGLVAIAIFASLMLVPPGTETPLSRLTFNGSSVDTSGETVNARTETNRVAIEQINADPLVGQGFGDGTTSAGYEVHNILLQVWYEGGVIACLGIILSLVAVVLRSWGALRLSYSSTTLDHAMNGALAASFAGFLTYAMAALLLYKRFAWISPALVTASYFVSIGWATRPALTARRSSEEIPLGTASIS